MAKKTKLEIVIGEFYAKWWLYYGRDTRKGQLL